MSDLPPCGLYRTRRALGEIPAGKLVSFHNHENPGVGIYEPSGWHQNRARFHTHGTPVPDRSWAEDGLEPLPPEGFYRVVDSFECCEKGCRTFERELLVQLGYDADARAILFVPEWGQNGFALPERGSHVELHRLAALRPLRVPGTSAGQDRLLH
jgi:hypothetical protein